MVHDKEAVMIQLAFRFYVEKNVAQVKILKVVKIVLEISRMNCSYNYSLSLLIVQN